MTDIEEAKAWALEALSYDPATGQFTWKKGRRQGRHAGFANGGGYVGIKVKELTCLAHRLAWLLVHGDWPSAQIDHINGDPADNRIANLRLATPAQNGANARRRSDNRSGFKGVGWHKKTRKWRANIVRDGRMRSLGYFDTPEQAAEAYATAAKALRGEFARTE